MSHSKERKEKVCLNCNAALNGRYCQVCGQENVEPRESAWHLVNHFFQDITHFDGKFFSSLKYLVTRPGFLSAEYSRGRRASYLNPVRMYVFSSALFFLIFFTFFKIGSGMSGGNPRINGKTKQQVTSMSTREFEAYLADVDDLPEPRKKSMSREGFLTYFDSAVADEGFQFTPGKYRSKGEYDSLLASGAKKHNWLERRLTYRQLELNEKFKGRRQEFGQSVMDIFIHKLPQVLFVSLPLLALLLKLLYIRHKGFYYVSHGIFSIHFYIFLFILFLCMMAVSKLNGMLHWGGLTFLNVMLGLGILYYLYRAMRNFYGQSRGKTFLKFSLLTAAFSFILVLLFIVFIIFSFFSV